MAITLDPESGQKPSIVISHINAHDFSELQQVASVQILSFDPFPEYTDVIEPLPRLPFEQRIDSLARRLAYKLTDRDGKAASHIGYKATNDQGEIVGIAYWMKPAMRFKLYDPETMTEKEKGMYAQYDMKLYSSLYQAFQEKIDMVTESRPTWYLEILAIHPGHQKQSIGSRLLDHHLSNLQADELAWLESSPAGKRLYLSRGYEDVGEVVADGWSDGFPAMMRKSEKERGT
ncbi:hypothetical protein NliqN6_0802 [Naganishia liquefaciens]|uniref:N-acetyltransferase domain-containing protein n=1 Tax=Naganishia liquefaciens TaxID=104408 RepID=A0A8H3YCJ7_9TREE|nr:hypothetical protein NliqN6_0802 [Naganishia liquefaciens]